MGISGLLTFLKDAQEEIHIKKYKGKVLGIDAYGWLHKGAHSCAQELALGKFTRGYVNYAMKRINMLKYHGVIPYVVFDGGYLPAKAGTEKERAQRREKNLKMAKLHFHNGAKKDAREHFVKCIDVTHTMAYEFIKALREAEIDFIVAPYEADAQLAYLEKTNTIDGIITEDSDLLVFGCRTILYKLNEEGFCMEMLYENRGRCKKLQSSLFSDDLFRQMAILSGCDYLDSIHGIGLRKAYSYLRKGGSVSRALVIARLDGKNVPTDYKTNFERAEKTFIYQRVFDRCKKTGETTMVTLQECDDIEAIENEDCIGPLLPKNQIEAISRGDMDPITKSIMRGAQQSIARSASAPSSLKLSKSKAGSFREGSTAGQRSLDSYLKRNPAEDKKSESYPSSISSTRIPLLATQGKDESMYSATHLSEMVESNGFSKYFLQKSPVLESKIEKQMVTLASFTPTQKQGKFQRCASTDSGEISSPVSSARKTKHLQGQHSSPIADDQSSPMTSPLSIRNKSKKTNIITKQDQAPFIDISESDIEEVEEETTISTTTTSFFEKFAFNQDTPTNGRIIGGGWTREKIEGSGSKWTDNNRSASQSVNRSTSGGKRSSVAAFLQFRDEQEDDDHHHSANDTPAFKRRCTESDRTKMNNTDLLSLK